jgi:putative zinc finger/helix-turn-helix YgiT family protein
MNGICPHCEKETELTPVTVEEAHEIRRERISVTANYLRCSPEGHLVQDPSAPCDSLDLAYREFRRRHGMLSPEDIRSFRTGYGLTQRQLSAILGWGGATLSRYENGALQDEAHDKLLRLAKDPRNLLALLDAIPGAVPPHTYHRLSQLLTRQVRERSLSLKCLYEDHFADLPPDEFSGYARLHIDKLFASVLFMCVGAEVFKTKLNKLLFYADFKHFKEYAVSITGARYAHLPYGPGPDKYDLLLAAMQDEERTIALEERVFPDYIGETVSALTPPDITLFFPSEVKILAEIKERFEGLTARQVSDLSHRERAFLETSEGDLIPYTFADLLSI